MYDHRYSASGQIKESEEHNLNIYAHRKSDKAIVVRKQANKMTIRFLSTEELIAELAEQRALTERNSVDKPGTATQCAGQTDSGLDTFLQQESCSSEEGFPTSFY